MEASEKPYKESSTTQKKTGGQPSKLIDLGAAATFAQQAQPPQQNTDSFLFDVTTQQPSKSSTGGFANFEGAFNEPPEENQAAGVCSLICSLFANSIAFTKRM